MGKIYYQNKQGDILVNSTGIPNPKKDATLAKTVIEEAKKEDLFKTINGEPIVGKGNIEVGGGNATYTEDGKLFVGEVKVHAGPTPIATIGGVDYYHKLDTTNIDISTSGLYYDLEGNLLPEKPSEYPYLETGKNYGPPYDFIALISSDKNPTTGEVCSIALKGTYYSIDSRKLTVVPPGQMTWTTLSGSYFEAGYLQASESNNKTGILYYNLVGETVENPLISTITDGTNEINIKDERLPVATSDDVGKCLNINVNGEYELSGTQLYKHLLIPPSGTSAPSIILLMTSGKQIWKQSNPFNNVLSVVYYQTSGYIFSHYKSHNLGYPTLGFVSYDINLSTSTETIINKDWTDTVTPL